MRGLRRFAYAQSGSTLVELIVAVCIMSVGILGLFGAFRFITRSIFVSRGQTLATNLGQERIEYLKNINYYALLVTTAPATDNSFTPAINYDTANYPPETITIAGISYTRYTHVSMAQVDNDLISEVAYTYPDTGLKQLTVHVIWMDNGVKKKWTLRNLLENPYVNPLDSTISGTISRAGGGTVAGALVAVEQNPDWNALTDSSGNYNFRVYHGTYSVRASSAGYYDAVSSGTMVAKGTTKVIDLTISPIATGTVSGAVWSNPDLVISQVVVNTFTWVGGGEEKSVEYIELFNPTTFPINIGSNTDPTPNRVTLLYYDEDGSFYRYFFFCANTPYVAGNACTGYSTHISSYVPAKSYYLIANATHFMTNGQWINADANYYNAVNPDYPDAMRNDKAGGLYLYMPSLNPFIVADSVGWADNDNGPPIYEGNYIPDIGGGNDGLGTPAGKQIVRVSSPGVNAALIDTLGRAYDSNNNARDFLYTYAGSPSFFYRPYNIAAGTAPVVAGKPMYSALITAGDTNSGSTLAATVFITSGSLSLPYAPFTLRGVSTGTWEVAVTTRAYPYGYHSQNGGSPRSYNYSQVISSVAITQNVITGVPNATTVSSWTASGRYHVFLDSVSSMGYVKGQVTSVTGVNLSGIKVEGGGNSRTTGANGLYFFSVSSGTFNLIANPNNLNSAYVQSIQSVSVSSATITTQDFSLALGAKVQGYATSGTTPLSNIVFAILSGGSQAGSSTTDATGVFNIRNISTGTYTVAPVLEVGQDSSPNSIAVTLTSTGTVFVGTFTVAGAFGSITGTVSDTSGLVTSGALIVAATGTISSTPPAIVGSSAPAMTPFYMISSKADGTYVLPVRGANTYYVSVYVPIITGAGVTVTTKTYSNVYVTPSAATTKNVTIP